MTSLDWLLVSELIATLFFLVYLFALAAFDWKKKLLPLEPMVAATIIAFLFRCFQFGINGLIMSGLGILIGVGFIGVQVWLSKGKWMGRGDIWFAASIGAYLMWTSMLSALYLAYTVGGVIAIILYFSGIYKRGMRIPFAPFLALGAVGALLWGSQIFIWFASGFGLV